ncbi:MAG: peptidoglycan editing factor PgeF [Clostridiales bacterium]|jgi:YfiH family protein|nr:peptidoglycan editing factor PgeF [Clostridiales bacterium]
MIISHKGAMPIGVFPDFEKAGLAAHGISTRIGGVSEGSFNSLNLGLGRGDSRENVLENFKRFFEAVGADMNSAVFSSQTHTSNVIIAEASDRGKGLKRKSDFHDVDGLCTNEPGLPLVTFYADCVPLLFYDPIEKAIAAAHAGWRGTANMIGMKAVSALVSAYGCKPENILAGIGPSIGPCCFEVDEPVALEFKKRVPGCEAFMQGPYGANKHKIDLWSCNKHILAMAGLKQENIDCSPLCTSCHSGLYYSHRRDGGARGSMAAVISL